MALRLVLAALVLDAVGALLLLTDHTLIGALLIWLVAMPMAVTSFVMGVRAGMR